ncbi:hypothetical protein [Fodinicola feengrottensis]|uniref:hypothetical protein n=1 Tax=Fodinicola feengrottensis TaxID=435914 RepID=UPI0013D30EDA|nr:hypothetical protein [Fodinicola feengrottensis]
MSRRVVAAAALGLIGGGTLLLGGTPAQAADNPTATVSGGCLTILACNMKFSSAQFTVPSGGQLVVKNSMNGLLNGPVTVSVGDQRKTIGSGGTATFSFSQSVDQQSYSMSAASALINSGAASQVMVAPMVKQPTQPSTPPASSRRRPVVVRLQAPAAPALRLAVASRRLRCPMVAPRRASRRHCCRPASPVCRPTRLPARCSSPRCPTVPMATAPRPETSLERVRPPTTRPRPVAPPATLLAR